MTKGQNTVLKMITV